jgi:outer membrane autotransporter protein
MPLTAAMSGGWRAWIRGSLARASFEDTGANFGFKSRTYSAEGGIERVVGQWMYGAAFGLGQAKVNQDTTGDNGRIDTVRAGAYASYRPGLWWLSAAMAVGLSNIDATRLALLPTPATSSYDATTFSAGLEARTRYRLSYATVEPLAGLAYTGLWVDGFSESGTTFLDLTGDRADINALKGYVPQRLGLGAGGEGAARLRLP